MRGDIDLAEFGDEAVRVEALVTAKGDLPGTVGTRFHQMQRRQPLGMAGGAGGERIDDQPFLFSISAWPMKQSFTSLPGPLR